MIYPNWTIGTRIDISEENISSVCMDLKSRLTAAIEARLNKEEVRELGQQRFALPKKREVVLRGMTSYNSKQSKAVLSEMMMKSKADIALSSSDFEETRRTKKIMDLILQFEDMVSATCQLSDEKMVLMRRLHREILHTFLADPEGGDAIKFTHNESLLTSIAMTTSSIVGFSLKLAFSIFGEIFKKKIKVSAVKKSKGYQCLKKAAFKVWHVN